MKLSTILEVVLILANLTAALLGRHRPGWLIARVELMILILNQGR